MTRKRKRVQNFLGDNLFDGAAALSFYFALALFPALLAGLSALSFFSLRDTYSKVPELWAMQVPINVRMAIERILDDFYQSSGAPVFSVALFFTLWASTSGVMATIRQLNVAHKCKETRPFYQLFLTAFILAIGIAMVFPLSFVVLVLGRWIIQNLLVGPEYHSDIMTWYRYGTVQLALFIIFLAAYRFGPNVPQKFKFTIPGAFLGSLLFIVASHVFSYYLANLVDYNAIYGGFGTIIALLLWLYIFGFLLIFGAEFNQLVREYLEKRSSS